MRHAARRLLRFAFALGLMTGVTASALGQEPFWKKQFQKSKPGGPGPAGKGPGPDKAERKAALKAELDGLIARTLALYNENRYSEAEASAKQIIARATAVGAPERVVGRGLLELARINYRLGQSKEGEQHARRALAIWSREFGASTPK